jgi:hypothetical protein
LKLQAIRPYFVPVFAAALCLGLAGLPLRPAAWLNAHLATDDGFYYLRIARNLAAGLGSTCDTFHRTNGYQPLWLWLLVPLAGLVKDPDALVLAAVLLQAVLAALALALAAQAQGRASWVSALPVLALAALPDFWRVSLSGLESSLLLLCLAWVWVELEPGPGRGGALDQGPGRAADRAAPWRLGLALSAAVLARTDSLILVGLVLCALAWQRGPWTRLLKVCCVLAACLGPYFLWNRLSFGLWMPISGAVKMAYAQVQATQASVGRHELPVRLAYLWWPLRDGKPQILVLLILDIVALVWGWGRGNTRLAVFGSAMVLKYLVYAAFFYNHAQYFWYYAPDLLVAALLAGEWLERAPARVSLAGGLAVLVLAALSAGGMLHARLALDRAGLADGDAPRIDLCAFRDMALLLNRDPAAAGLSVGMHNSGVFGYYFKGRTMNLDGLVSDKQRLSFIQRDGYNFIPYLATQPPLDAYTDFILTDQVPLFERIMPADLGLRAVNVETPLRAAGQWWDTPAGSMRLYSRRPLAGLEWR